MKDSETLPRVHIADHGFGCHDCEKWVAPGMPYIEPPHEAGYEGWSGVCLTCYDRMVTGKKELSFPKRLHADGGGLKD